MNSRELLARLNVPAVRYEIGRNGIAEITNLDVAHALGWVDDRFARDVFEAIWWPDGATRNPRDVGNEFKELIMSEYSARRRADEIAKLEHILVVEKYSVKRHRSEFDRQELQHAESKMSKAAENVWPFDAMFYARVFRSIVDEMRFPRLCAECAGRGSLQVDTKLMECKRCHSTGLRRATKATRAVNFGMNESQFKKTWDKIYDWGYWILREAEDKAARQIARSFARDEAA